MDQISTNDERAPLISIIIPTYNRASLIRETLDSIKAQTSSQWECIGVDDGSSDNTESVVAEYSAGDSRFSFYKRDREPKGAPTCRNIGLHHAKGEWVIFLDSDDLLDKKTVKFIAGINQSESNLHDAFIFRTNKFCDSRHLETPCFTPDLYQDDLREYLYANILWQTSGAVWRKEFVRRIGGFREALPKGQDWELAVRALLNGAKVKKYPFIASYHREGCQDRIAHQPETYQLHVEFLEASIDLIRLAKQGQQKFAEKSLCASALYRMASLIWMTNKLPGNKFINKFSDLYKKKIFFKTNLKIRLCLLYIIRRYFFHQKSLAEKIIRIDGIYRKIV